MTWLVLGVGYLPTELLVREAPETPQTIQAFALAFGHCGDLKVAPKGSGTTSRCGLTGNVLLWGGF